MINNNKGGMQELLDKHQLSLGKEERKRKEKTTTLIFFGIRGDKGIS